MKRISTLVLAASLLCGSMGAASAANGIDVKVKGQWDFTFGWAENTKFADAGHMDRRFGDGKRDDDNFIAKHRVRTQINFIASENLQGVLMFEIGDIDWGRDSNHNKSGQSSGGDLGADGVNVETKRAYLDWMIPDTGISVRMGIQGFALPMATELGNPVFNDDVAGIVTNYKFDDTFALTAFWLRPYNYNLNDGDGSNNHLDDEMDMFGFALPISLDGMKITPWGVWANVGSASGFYENAIYGKGSKRSNLSFDENDHASAWWAGVGVAVDMFDPLTFAVDAMYGSIGKNNIGNNAFDEQELNDDLSEISARGWFIAANLNYKLDWGTPGLFGWWSSGDSKEGINAGKLGRMPAPKTSTGFSPTTFGFDGAVGINSNDVVSVKGIGTWGVGIQVAEMSFIENLTHTIRFAYYSGTNDADIVKKYHDAPLLSGLDSVYLTDKDNAYEVNFDHKYQIYENLAAYLELGYIHLDLDKNTWKNYGGDDYHKTDDAWKAQIAFQYSF